MIYQIFIFIFWPSPPIFKYIAWPLVSIISHHACKFGSVTHELTLLIMPKEEYDKMNINKYDLLIMIKKFKID